MCGFCSIIQFFAASVFKMSFFRFHFLYSSLNLLTVRFFKKFFATNFKAQSILSVVSNRFEAKKSDQTLNMLLNSSIAFRQNSTSNDWHEENRLYEYTHRSQFNSQFLFVCKKLSKIYFPAFILLFTIFI